MIQERLKHLFDRYIDRSATETEEDELFRLVRDPEQEPAVRDWISQYIDQPKIAEVLSEQSTASILKSILQGEELRQPARVVRRKWMLAVAAVLFAVIGFTVFITLDKKPVQPIMAARQDDILPGTDGAVLTLSDGRQIILDSLPNGMISSDHGAAVVLQNGELVYDQASASEESLYNTLSTPNGRQFHVQLPDGSKVWLNAASSIRYPIVFKRDKREVQITGEVYFEVARDPGKRFIVQVGSQSEIEVLGTHFNINSYSDEDEIKTTLVEGSVKIRNASRTAILKPGEQASAQSTSDGPILITSDTDISQVLAWKNGLFSLNGVSLAGLMRQISRWYDIEVVYENGIPEMEFRGKMDRNVSLARLLYFLEGSGIRFRIDKEMKQLVLIK